MFIADQPFKRHMVGSLLVDNGLICAFSKSYFGPLQHWLESICVGTCYGYS